jgi:uncharacterized membrane protein YfcA
MDILFVLVSAGLAGFVDAVVGGGGLILVPAIFSAYPQVPAATLLGNNKSVSLWGTLFASWNYARSIEMPWKKLLFAAAFAAAFSFIGAWTLGQVPSSGLKKALPVVLALILIYTLLSRKLGSEHQPRFEGKQELGVIFAVAACMGFYDGFFGPGTGSFYIFIFVRLMRYDFLHASSAAKILNSASNAAALFLFTLQGQIWWHLAIPMAVMNVLGSALGTRMAIRKGSEFVRWMFVLVVTSLILKTTYDAYLAN